MFVESALILLLFRHKFRSHPYQGLFQEVPCTCMNLIDPDGCPAIRPRRRVAALKTPLDVAEITNSLRVLISAVTVACGLKTTQEPRGEISVLRPPADVSIHWDLLGRLSARLWSISAGSKETAIPGSFLPFLTSRLSAVVQIANRFRHGCAKIRNPRHPRHPRRPVDANHEGSSTGRGKRANAPLPESPRGFRPGTRRRSSRPPRCLAW